MFGTFRYDPEENEPRFIASVQGNEFIEAGMPQHSACENCHERKLRCGGQKPTCDRCKKGKVTCKYTSSTERRKRRKENSTSTNRDPKASRRPRKTASISKAPQTSSQAPGNDHPAGYLASPSTPLVMNEDVFLQQESDEYELSSLDSASSTFDDSLLDQDFDDAYMADAGYLLDPTGTSACGEMPGYLAAAAAAYPTTMADLNAQSTALPTANILTAPPSLASSLNQQPLSVDITNTTSAATTNHPNSLYPGLHNVRNTCDCVERALELFDGLQLHSGELQSSQIISALDHQKRALRQYSGTLLCGDCLQKTTRITLLVMGCEWTVAFCERIVVEYLNLQRPQSPNRSDAPMQMQMQTMTPNLTPTATPGLGLPASSVSIGGYEIDSQDELMAVLKTLIATRLKEAMHILVCIREMQCSGMRAPHRAKLNAALERLKRIAARLR